MCYKSLMQHTILKIIIIITNKIFKMFGLFIQFDITSNTKSVLVAHVRFRLNLIYITIVFLSSIPWDMGIKWCPKFCDKSKFSSVSIQLSNDILIYTFIICYFDIIKNNQNSSMNSHRISMQFHQVVVFCHIFLFIIPHY